MLNIKLGGIQKYQLLLSGLIAGFSFYLIIEKYDNKYDDFNKDYFLAFIIFLFYSSKSSMLMAHIPNIKKTLLISLGIGLLIGLLSLQYFIHVGYNEGLTSSNDALVNYFLSIHFAFFLLITFIQTYNEKGLSLPYSSLFSNAWNNAILTVLPCALVSIFYIALFLVSALFDIVNITFLNKLLEEAWFNLPLIGLLYSAAILYLREHEKTMLAARRFAMAMARIVGLLLCSAALIFLINLPISGIQVLWDSKMGASILLIVVLVTGFYANSYIGDGDGTEWKDVVKWQRWIVMSATFAMPIFLILCAYAFYLRIDQYGLTADRVYSFPIITLALLFSVGYCWHIIIHKENWVMHVGNTNKYLAGLSMLVALAMQLAPISAYTIASNSQYNKIISQKNSLHAKNIDFWALKFKSAKPGRTLYNKLLNDETKLGKLASSKEWLDVKSPGTPYESDTNPTFIRYKNINLDDLIWVTNMGEITVVDKKTLTRFIWNMEMSCFSTHKNKCYIWQQDINNNGIPEIIMIKKNIPHYEISVFLPKVSTKGNISWWFSQNTFYDNQDINKEIIEKTFQIKPPLIPNITFNGTVMKMPEPREFSSE